MIVDFQHKVWDYINSLHAGEFVKSGFRLSSDCNVANRYNYVQAHQFLWLFFYYSLLPVQRKYLDCSPLLTSKLVAYFKSIPEHATKSLLIDLFSNEEFSFVNSETKDLIISRLLSFSIVAVQYKQGDFLDSWQKEPENWIINYSKLKFGASLEKNRDLLWILANVIYKLGFDCLHSQASYYLYIYFTNEPVDEVNFDYTSWHNITKDIQPREEILSLELAIDLFIHNSFEQQKFIQFCYPDLVAFDEFSYTTKNIIQQNVDRISDKQLIKFLYFDRLSKNQLSEKYINSVFKDYDKNFVSRTLNSDNDDWTAFWLGVKEFTKRATRSSIRDKNANLEPLLNTSDLVELWFRTINYNPYQESLWCLALDSKSRLIDYKEVSRGTFNKTIAHPREILSFCLQSSALCLILIHNHPSGDPSPSDMDYHMTDKIKESAILFGIKLVDHIIIGKHSYFSFANKKIIHTT